MKVPETGMTRSIGLVQATAINMIDMIGIGPFVAMPLIMQLMGAGDFIYAWVLGALIAGIDGMVWAELGAALPEAGGSYQFLKAAFSGHSRWGKLMPFLFVWQTLFQAPLVVASGAIGFAQYLGYLIPLGYFQQKGVAAVVVVLVTLLLYRRTAVLGRIAVLLWAGVILTILGIISGGIWFAHTHPVVAAPPLFSTPVFTGIFVAALGHATVRSMYCYLGYYNVCQLGSEIRNPGRNIPRSIFWSVAGVAVLYCGMNLSIARVVPFPVARNSSFIVSTFVEMAFGRHAAGVATVLVLWIAFASLFSVMLGYTRIPFAAARDGNFFPAFARLHPTKGFPQVSLLALGGTALVFSLLFRLTDVIVGILAMRILVQFIGQAVGLMLLRRKRKGMHFPFRMWLYPLPVLGSIAAWLYVYFFTGWEFAFSGLAMTAAGTVIFLVLYKRNGKGLFSSGATSGPIDPPYIAGAKPPQ